MAWFLELKWRGEDAYPILREKFRDPILYSKPDAHWAGADIVRVEIFRAFGYFNTESSQHISEYLPYFRKRPELFKKFKLTSPLEMLERFEKNLLRGCCVEVPCLIDKSGIHPCYIGDLPPQCAALNRTNINVQELGVKAAVEKDRTLAFQAILVDPLTSAVLTIDETEKMVDEMFRAESEFLKDFK